MIHVHGRSGDPTQRDVGQTSGSPTSQKMLLDNLLTAPGIRLNAAFFQPGSRTGWHSHSNGQLFIVQQGRGIVASEGTLSVARAGDIIYSPPGEKHWHGAAPDSFFMYMAASLGDTTWLDQEVLDPDYLAAFA